MHLRLLLRALAASLGLGLLLSGCGGEDAFEDGGGDAAAPTASPTGGARTGGAGETLVVGSAGFTEIQLLAEMYALLLEDAGYDADIRVVENREIYAPALERGEIDVVPEYAATMAEFLNRQENGPDAEPVASSDVQETVQALRDLAQQRGLEVLEPAEAVNQNAFVVTEDYAQENDLSTLTDLGELGEPVVLAATEECPERPFCEPGLEETYGIEVTEVLPLGFGSVQTKEAVRSGEADLGLTGTTDGTLEQFGLVVLEDDQNLQLADNLVPVVGGDAAGDETVADALNQLADVLTTEDLAELNRRVDAEREQAGDVARDYLESEGLLDG